MSRKPLSRIQLQRKVKELEANLAHAYHFADATLHKAAMEQMFGSGVLLELTALGGTEVISPVLILDGLSPETIEALRNDIRRSYERATEFKPSARSK